jgi:ABC-type nitrate/sulfonate/bicarbonate transport system substrate-binding protein
MLEYAGIALDTLETVDVPLPTRLDALRKGVIDAAFAGEPWLTRITSGGYGELWIAAHKALPGFETGLVFFGPSLLNGNREGGRRFMLAYRDAVLRYQEGKTPRNVDILARATGDTPDIVRRSCWVPIRADGRVDLASYATLQAWGVRMGMIDTPATPAQFWDSSFVVYADSVMGRRPQ